MKLAYADIVLGVPDWTQFVFSILINDLCADYIALHEEFARSASFSERLSFFAVDVRPAYTGGDDRAAVAAFAGAHLSRPEAGSAGAVACLIGFVECIDRTTTAMARVEEL